MKQPKTPRLDSRLRELLGHRGLVWLVFAAAVLISLPTLDVGLFGDDLWQAEFLTAQRDGTSSARWWDMFMFVSGPAAHNEQLRASAQLPWWVDLNLHVAFFRPLSVVTHQLDHRVWPSAPWAMHLHSLLWYATACALVWVVARRLCSSFSAAGVASLVYVMSFGHLVPVGWLAHRNALISTVFSLLSILAHDRWRRDGDNVALLLAPVALAAALLAGEAGLVTLAFLMAYALCLDSGPRVARAMSLVPSLLVIAVWRVLWDSLGYGATGSGAYLDPVAGFVELVSVFPQRYFALLAFCVSPPFMTDAPALLWWGATLLLFGAVVVFTVKIERPAARFGALAAALGCIPMTASVPFERLLVLTSFGMALAWGELLDTWLLARSRALASGAMALLVVVVHLLVSPIAFVSRGLELDQARPSAALFAEDAWPGSPDMEGKTVVLIHTPNYIAVDSLARVLHAAGPPEPARILVLHAGTEPPQIKQIDAHTIELRAPHGWPAGDVTTFWRSPSQAPFMVGDRIPTRDFTAVVEEVADGKATRVRFEFERSLSDPSQVWLLWVDGQHRRVNPLIW